MNDTETRAWLDNERRRILGDDTSISDPEIDAFVNSATVAIRYAWLN